MPLPMVHFKTAYSVLSSNTATDIDLPQYYVGSLAPDGVHSRKNYALSDRSKSHFEDKDISRWFDNIHCFLINHKTSIDFSFYLGYAVHIMTDIIWQENIFNRFHQEYQKIKQPGFLNERQAYVSEMCLLDIQIYNTEIAFRKEIRNFLQQAKAIGIHPFVSDEEIEKEKELTLLWYDNKKTDLMSVPNLITITDVYRFIAMASEEICLRLKNVI